MTIDSINNQGLMPTASSSRTVSVTQQQNFEQQLQKSAQAQELVVQAKQSLLSGDPQLAARYLSAAAQQIDPKAEVINSLTMLDHQIKTNGV